MEAAPAEPLDLVFVCQWERDRLWWAFFSWGPVLVVTLGFSPFMWITLDFASVMCPHDFYDTNFSFWRNLVFETTFRNKSCLSSPKELRKLYSN